jgi:hypothetical protein
MVLPILIPILGVLGGVVAGAGLAKGGGGDSASWGGSLKKSQDSFSYQSSYQFSPTTSNSFSYSPTDNFAPVNDFSPITIIGSPNTSLLTKKALSQDFTTEPSFSSSTNPSNALSPSQSTTQGMGSSGSSILDDVKQYAVLGGIGFLAYLYLTRGKNKK